MRINLIVYQMRAPQSNHQMESLNEWLVYRRNYRKKFLLRLLNGVEYFINLSQRIQSMIVFHLFPVSSLHIRSV